MNMIERITKLERALGLMADAHVAAFASAQAHNLAAVKALETEIEALKARVAELEGGKC